MKYLLSLAFIFFASQIGHAQQDTIKVLFVGNSYTYFWNLPQQVQAMAKATDVALVAKQSTSGGRNLGHHWNGNRGLQSKEIIEQGKFDFVVLQNHSMRAQTQPDSLVYYGRLFGNLITKSGGKPVIYSTWSRRWDRYMEDVISAKDKELAGQINAKIASAGATWERALELRPNLAIYDPDGSHPSPLGQYLNACLFYSVLTGKSPIGLPTRLIAEDKDGEKLYLNIVNGGDALFCQKIVAEVLGFEF